MGTYGEIIIAKEDRDGIGSGHYYPLIKVTDGYDGYDLPGVAAKVLMELAETAKFGVSFVELLAGLCAVIGPSCRSGIEGMDMEKALPNFEEDGYCRAILRRRYDELTEQTVWEVFQPSYLDCDVEGGLVEAKVLATCEAAYDILEDS